MPDPRALDPSDIAGDRQEAEQRGAQDEREAVVRYLRETAAQTPSGAVVFAVDILDILSRKFEAGEHRKAAAHG